MASAIALLGRSAANRRVPALLAAAVACTAGQKYVTAKSAKIATQLGGFLRSDLAKPYNRVMVVDAAVRLAAVKSASMALGEGKSLFSGPAIEEIVRNAANEAVKRTLVDADMSFVNKEGAASIARTIDQGSRAAGQLITALLFRVIPTAIDLGLMYKALKSGKGGLVSRATLAAYLAFTLLVAEARVPRRLSATEADSRYRMNLYETAAQIEGAKLAGAADSFAERSNELKAWSSRKQRAVSTGLAALNAGQSLILQVGQAGALASEPARAFEMGTRFESLARPLFHLGTTWHNLRTSAPTFLKLVELLRKAEQRDYSGFPDLQINRGTIVLDDVSFTHACAAKPAVSGLSLRVPGGSSLGVVGPSGSGKSTLLRLISRLYSPDSGTISICGQDVHAVNTPSLRAAVGVVPQEPMIFDGSLYSNVALRADPNTKDEDVLRAVHLAGLAGLMHRLGGLHGAIGERGQNLSGGERQRIAIARLLLQQPKLLLLDEATSSLDAITEARVLDSLRGAFAGRTRVVVAHRLKAVMDCDNIIYLENGQIAEQGTHEELLRLGGKYARLWRLQTAVADEDLSLLAEEVERGPSSPLAAQQLHDAVACSVAGCCSH